MTTTSSGAYNILAGGDIVLDTGDSSAMRIKSSALVFNNAANNEHMIVAAQDGAVTLYHNGVAQLRTVDGHITVGDSSTPVTLGDFGEVNSYLIANSTSSSASLRFHVGGGQSNKERLRIDASGRHYIGKTASNLGVSGIELNPGGYLQVTESQSPALYLSRLTDDGNIINFYKSSAIMGQIGTYGGTLYIGSGAGGIMFNGTTIEPTTGATGRQNNTVNLGSNTYRFKDLRLNGYTYSAGFTTQTSMAGIGVSQGDVNAGELGPGYITLSRDDTANADQILLMKNGNLHTKMITVANQFKIHHQGSDIHLMTSEGGTPRRINFSGSIPSWKPFDSNTGQIDLGTASGKWKDLYMSGGIQFDSRGNKLDDYEEGTFNPVVANGTYTYSYRRGHYVKIGNLVHIHIGFKLNAATPNTALGTITGLPFTSITYGSYQEPHARIGAGGLLVTANLGSHLTFYKGNSNTSLFARTTSGNIDQPVNSNLIWKAGTFIKFDMIYTTA
jgi:hypothetical protein